MYADGAHPTSWGTDPVRYTSVVTATQRRDATRVTTNGETQENGPHSREFPASEPFPQGAAG